MNDKFRVWTGGKMIYIGSKNNDTALWISENYWAAIDHFTGKHKKICDSRDINVSLMKSAGIEVESKEVYIGDVITLYKDSKEYFTGKVTDHQYNGITIDSKSDYMEFGLPKYEYKLIGNIHEHPELLK